MTVLAGGSIVSGNVTLASGKTHTARLVPGTPTLIGLPRSEDLESQIICASADSDTIVGNAWSSLPYFGSSQAFRWTPGGSKALGVLPGDSTSEATAVSSDGKRVVRHPCDSMGVGRPFLWQEATGRVELSTLPCSSLMVPSRSIARAKWWVMHSEVLVSLFTA